MFYIRVFAFFMSALLFGIMFFFFLVLEQVEWGIFWNIIDGEIVFKLV